MSLVIGVRGVLFSASRISQPVPECAPKQEKKTCDPKNMSRNLEAEVASEVRQY
jgi:hypothetical protein